MPNIRIQYRRDTTAGWTKANPILADGEVGYERSDNPELVLQKVGDGKTHWLDLPYASGPIGPVGLAPEHEWQSKSLRFKNPDGEWGALVNLQGPQGVKGEKGDIGPNIPATTTTLGSIIVGDGFSIAADGKLSIDIAALATALAGNTSAITSLTTAIAAKLAADPTSLNKIVTAMTGDATAMQAIANALADTNRAITVVNNKLGVNIDNSTLGAS